jgi:cell division protein FtsQ
MPPLAKSRPTTASTQSQGFWDQPALLNLTADALVVAGLVLLGWAAAIAIQRLPFYPLRELVVTSTLTQASRSQIEHAARTALAGNFFTVNLDSARGAFEKLPWVRKAQLRRRWPDALELAVEEHAAVALWRQADGESRLVNSFGEVFAGTASQPLPVFAGPEGTAAEMLGRYREFSEALAALGRSPVSVTLSAREAWQVKLDNGTVLDLGRDEAKHPLAERVARFVAHWPAAVEKTRIAAGAVADMRYPNGFALRVARSS